MSLPNKIDPCPIVDALIEIRFSACINSNAIFGVVYNALQKDYPQVENLPILQIPEIIRISDLSFKFKPHYKISNESFVIQIGPEVLTISSFPKYVGWSVFSDNIFKVLDLINSLNIISDVHRLGIRYVNFFSENIFENILLNVNLSDTPMDYKNTFIKTEIDEDNFTSTLQIANNVPLNGVNGSFIDIDTSTNIDLSNFFTNKESLINKGHSIEKALFFKLLKVDFLKKHNPIY